MKTTSLLLFLFTLCIIGGILLPASLAFCTCLSPPLKGDMNCDDVVDLLDINPFILALSNPEAYEAAYPYCDIMNADCNYDDVVDLRDINPFVAILTAP